MFIAFPIILLSLVALGVQAVGLTVPGTVTIGQSAQVQWDLDHGIFGSLDISLVIPGAGSRKLATIDTNFKQNGEASVPFPDDLTPGDYHLEADSFNFNVGSSGIFSLVSPPPPTTTSTTDTSQSTPASTTQQSQSQTQSQTQSPTSTSSHSLTNQSSSSETNTQPSRSQSTANSTLSGSGSVTDGSTIITNSSSIQGPGDQTAAIAGGTSSAAAGSPSDTSTPNLSGNTEQSSSKPTSIIVGVVVGSIAFIALLIFLTVVFTRRRNQRKRTTFYRDRMVRSPGSTPLNASNPDFGEKRTQTYHD